MEIRIAEKTDIPAIMAVLDAAKGIMRDSGNANQWVNGYPAVPDIEKDLDRDAGRVLTQEGRIVGYFAFVPSPEPTYAYIEDGQWLDDTLPYHVIHRIASLPEVHGVFSAIMDYAFSADPNIRIDTHKDNRIMQHNILKHGFTYCGIIYLASGDTRLAYQRIRR